MKEFITVCPRNCYSTCSFKVVVENNKILYILPDKNNPTVPEGPCIKGLSYIERSASDKRLTRPLLKNADGQFEEIEYQKALEIIAQKLSKLRNESNQKAVLYYSGSGMAGLTNEISYNFFDLYGGATTTYGNFCWPAGLEAVRLSLGEIKHNAPWDLENAKTIIIWGKNPAETNIQETIFIDRARQKGAKIIVIDPRRTATADKADIVYQIKPGTDAALALCIAGILIKEDNIDKEFIKEHVKGYKEFAESLNTITLKETTYICGIPESAILSLAEQIASSKALTIIPGFGMQRYTNGGQSVRAILSLIVLTGNLGKTGCGFNYANLQGYIYDSLKEPLSYYPHLNTNPKFRRSVSMALLANSLNTISDPEIEFAWIERGNPLTQAPDTSLLLKAFRRIKFKVVVDQFITDTAKEADLILPAKNMFEQQDIISSYWSPYIHYRPAILKAPGEIRTEANIFYDLACMLGLDIDNDKIPEPGIELLDKWLEKRIEGLSTLTLDDLKHNKQLPPGFQEIAYNDYVFETESSKIELSSNELSRLWKGSPVPVYNPAFSKEDKKSYPYIFLSPNTKNRIHSQFGNLDILKHIDPEPLLEINTLDAIGLGLSDGEYARVYNNRGEIKIKIKSNSGILRGVVSMPNGWWLQEKGGGNMLSIGRETDMGYGTAFHDNRVAIEKSV